MGSWFNGKGGSIRKRQYYVWFLGSQDSGGPPNPSSIPSAIESLVKDYRERVAHKVTVQVSEKGIKVIQTIPTINKSGKMRMEVIKTPIPPSAVVAAGQGEGGLADVLGTLLLPLRPSPAPFRIHCYRCDSPETAQDMNDAMQQLIARSENAQRAAMLKEQLFLRNHDRPPHQRPPETRRPREQMSVRDKLLSEGFNGFSSDEEEEEEDVSPTRDSLRVARLHRALFHELKDRLLRKAQKNNSYRTHPFDLPPSPVREPTRRHGSADLHRKTSPTHFFQGRADERRGKPRSKSSSRRDDTLLTSSTSGFGSDLSSPDERGRGSMTELRCFHPSAEDEDPNFPTVWHPSWSKDRRKRSEEDYRNANFVSRRPYGSTDHLHNVPNQFPGLKPPRERTDGRGRPAKKERLFGDTVKVVAGRQPPSGIGPGRNGPDRMGQRPAHHLPNQHPPPGRPHVAMRNQPVNQNNWITRRRLHRSLDNLHFMQYPSSPPGSPEPWVAQRRERKFSNFVDPSGRRYERSTNIGGWGPRRASWYVPPNHVVF